MNATSVAIASATPGPTRPSRMFRGLIHALLLSVIGASAILASWFATVSNDESGPLFLASLLTVATMSALAAARYAIMRGLMVGLMRVASLALFAGLALIMIALATIYEYSYYAGFEAVWQWGFVFLLFGGTVAHHGVFRLLPSPTRFITVLRWLVMILTAGLALLTLVFIWDPYSGPSWALAMAIPAILFVAISGTVIVPIAAVMRAGRDRRIKESLSADVKLEFTCPGCRVKSVASPGLVRCKGCAFTMLLDIEEPRCACGYLLFKLVGDTCPECGRAVWASIAPQA